CIYDRFKKIGGLAHILLPTDTTGGQKPEKYANTAVPLLIERLIKEGANKEHLSAKIVGGSSMFKFKSNLALGQIGDRNIEETKKVLKEKGIEILAEDLGGNVGRVINFYMNDGHLKVKAAGQEKIYYKI
ncbi:chemotaxis protein CheD, partial [Spirochaetota bacterium]